MAFKALSPEQFEELRKHLGLVTFGRPWAALIDPGDLGTVFTYLPLTVEEYGRLTSRLQSYVYKIGEGRYGLVGFVPRAFELPRDGELRDIAAEYNQFGQLRQLTYTMDVNSKVYPILHPFRQEMLLTLAKKKKLNVRTVIRSH